MPFIITSNLFLLLPVVASAIRGDIPYLLFSSALCITSPLYHILKTYYPKSLWLPIIRNADWAIAVASYIYMLYFVMTKTSLEYRGILITLLATSALFFIYGFRFGNYKRLHPWFHIIAPIISALIVSL